MTMKLGANGTRLSCELVLRTGHFKIQTIITPSGSYVAFAPKCSIFFE